jgi:hypothetical protein
MQGIPQVMGQRHAPEDGNSSAPARRTAIASIIRDQVVGRQSELVAMLRSRA